eukprot:TRINITY_DN14619_c0_g1_i1.p1 TRINITY_DN14619_c0_g1~~TRINITY_DN14619_c0_g1_i1.p1  ORF type:complete len:121 (-),score=30.09 TRINITY_DN14619_c0_g1_i1:119-481(-)
MCASSSSKENEIKKDEEISEEIFKEFTDLETIEKIIFGSFFEKKHDVFVLRLFVLKTNTENRKNDYFKGFFSNINPPLGYSYVAVQIADKFLVWNETSLVIIHEFEGSDFAASFCPVIFL